MSCARTADRARIADIEAEIQKLKRTIRAFRTEQEVIQARLNLYKYPVATLPNEIVSEIFIHFLPVYPVCPKSQGILSPTVLTHISRKWREIALTTPTLWRALSFDWSSDDASEAQVRISEAWISRSGCCPLSIQMNDDISMGEVPEAKLLEAILPHRARWEHMTLVLSLSRLLEIAGPMPQLRELEIRIPHNARSIPFALQDVPRLRAVTLWDFTYPPGFLPWYQLTSLTLVAKEPDECTPILAQTVNLVHCKLVISGEAGDDLPDIRLPFLESLSLVYFIIDEPPSTRYLSTFIVPALRRLQIPEEFIDFGIDAFETFSSFISKSGCELREVCLTGAISRRVQIRLTTKFPSIQFSFDADLIDWYDDF